MTFEFIPLDEAPPDKGERLDLQVLNPSYEAELAEYRAQLDRNPFAENEVRESYVPELSDSADALFRADEVCIPQQSITIVVGYPFADQYAVALRASTAAGFTRADFFRQLVSVHTAMYEGATLSAVEHLDNTRVESPRFGTAWHVLDDLVLEEVLLQTRDDGRVFAWIYIGS